MNAHSRAVGYLANDIIYEVSECLDAPSCAQLRLTLNFALKDIRDFTESAMGILDDEWIGYADSSCASFSSHLRLLFDTISDTDGSI